MKTTIDVSETLFLSAKRLALKNNTTMRALVEEGLRQVIRGQSTQLKKAFTLKDMRVSGGTMLISNPADWHAMEDAHIVAGIAQSAKKNKKSNL